MDKSSIGIKMEITKGEFDKLETRRQANLKQITTLQEENLKLVEAQLRLQGKHAAYDELLKEQEVRTV